MAHTVVVNEFMMVEHSKMVLIIIRVHEIVIEERQSLHKRELHH